MSWTSESEPQSHTTDEADSPAVDTNGSPTDDGPLDPSLFFGLFDDLSNGEPAGDQPGEEPASEDSDAGPASVQTTVGGSKDEPTTHEPDEESDPVLIPDGSGPDHSGSDESGPAASKPVDESPGDGGDGLFGILEELLPEPSPPNGETDHVSSGDRATADDQETDSDVVVLGGDPADDATTEPEPDDPQAAAPMADNRSAEETDSAGSMPEWKAVEVQASDGVVTVKPMAGAGVRQPVASPPEVSSRLPDSDREEPPVIGTSEPPVGDRDSAPGPGMGIVLAAVLLTLVMMLIAATMILRDDNGAATESNGATTAAPAAGAEPITDQTAAETVEDVSQPDQDADATNNAAQVDVTTEAGVVPAVAALSERMAEGRVDLTSIRFVPGTVDLNEDSGRLLQELAEALQTSGGQPVSVVVRTYSEATPAENQALSEAQAATIVRTLTTEGVPADQLIAVGRGSGPLSPQQPVPDFVVVNPELGDAVFKQVIADIGIFTLGSQLDSTDSGSPDVPLRLESLAVIDGVGQALINFEDSTIGLAGYSYFEPDNEANRTRAGEVSSTVVRRLSELHDIAPDRVTVITPGAAPYVVTPEIGNHVWIRAGAGTTAAFEVAGVDTSSIDFEPGSATPNAASTAVLDQLAAALATSTDTLVIDVRTYSEESGAANMELSQARADAIAGYLAETGGIDADRLKAFGSGASSYFTDEGDSHVTVTVTP